VRPACRAPATVNFMRGYKLLMSQAYYFLSLCICLITVSVPLLHSRSSNPSLHRLTFRAGPRSAFQSFTLLPSQYILLLAAQAPLRSLFDLFTILYQNLVIMKYFAALSVAASMVAAQGNMQVMPLAPAVAAGAATHTVSIIATVMKCSS
jgi:hypothetical protein